MIQNIVFDIGDVLIDFHWKRTMKEHGFSDEVICCLEQNMMMSPDWNQLDLNMIPENDIFDRFKKAAPQYADKIDQFRQFKSEIVSPFPGVREWMQDLKKRGYHIYLLSNYPESYFKIHAKERFHFMDLIDGSVISYEVQCVKPDHRIYEHLLKKYDLKPETCVFMDDRPVNVQAARELGMQAFVYTSQEQAKCELEDILALCFTRQDQKCIYEGTVMSLWKDHLELPDGSQVIYDMVKQKGGACVLPVDEEQNVYLVKQYRNTLNRVNLELPAGCYAYPGEPPMQCASRELKEELGIIAEIWHYMTEIITDIGISDEKVAIFHATGLTFGTCKLDEDERIHLVKLPINEAVRLVQCGEIVDAKTVVAILGYKAGIWAET